MVDGPSKLTSCSRCSRARWLSSSSRRGMERGAVQVGREEVDGPGAGVVTGPAARIAGEVHGELGAAMVRAVGREDLVAAGVEPGHADGMLIGIRTAVGEEDLIQLPGGPLRDQAGCLGAGVIDVARGDGAQFRCLGRDCGYDGGVLVADVCVDQLGREVQILVALTVPDVGSLGRGDHHGVQEVLGGPGMEDVLAVQFVRPAGAFGVVLERQNAAVKSGSHVECLSGVAPVRRSAGIRG